jgi:hypothetical protein
MNVKYNITADPSYLKLEIIQDRPFGNKLNDNNYNDSGGLKNIVIPLMDTFGTGLHPYFVLEEENHAIINLTFKI